MPVLKASLFLIGIALGITVLVRRLMELRQILKRQVLKRRGEMEFEFHPELFELRTQVIELLAEHDLVWLSDYGAVDLQHDLFGLEVTGIQSEQVAFAIQRILAQEFPKWPYRRTFFEDLNVGELGWKVMISRYPEDFDDIAWKSEA
jgi:hypothetical protein